MSAFAAFFTESRMRLIDSTKAQQEIRVRAGLRSVVPSGLVPTRPDGWFVFAKGCPNEPLEKS
jgi:hypothetical protein